jgi:alpha-beta hydrolase superfamily lysophospholipase
VNARIDPAADAARPPSVPVVRRLRGLAAWAGMLLLAYAVLVGALYLWQEQLLFHPLRLPPSYRFVHGSDVHEVHVDVPGARLHALHLRLPRPKGVVFFLHGNAGNVASWFTNVDFYRRANIDLFMLDYRGYGKSTGRIQSEAQLRSDVRAAWQAIAPLYAGRQRVVYGRSLGTGLAAGLAAEVQPELTILVSPYRSMQAMAREHYPWVPGLALRYPLRTEDDVARIRGPVWLVHGDQDTLIAPHHSAALRERVPQARLLLVPGAGHNDLQRFDAYLEGLEQVLARL